MGRWTWALIQPEQVASKILGIACFPSQHMLTASIPSEPPPRTRRLARLTRGRRSSSLERARQEVRLFQPALQYAPTDDRNRSGSSTPARKSECATSKKQPRRPPFRPRCAPAHQRHCTASRKRPTTAALPSRARFRTSTPRRPSSTSSRSTRSRAPARHPRRSCALLKTRRRRKVGRSGSGCSQSCRVLGRSSTMVRAVNRCALGKWLIPVSSFQSLRMDICALVGFRIEHASSCQDQPR